MTDATLNPMNLIFFLTTIFCKVHCKEAIFGRKKIYCALRCGIVFCKYIFTYKVQVSKYFSHTKHHHWSISIAL